MPLRFYGHSRRPQVLVRLRQSARTGMQGQSARERQGTTMWGWNVSPQSQATPLLWRTRCCGMRTQAMTTKGLQIRVCHKQRQRERTCQSGQDRRTTGYASREICSIICSADGIDYLHTTQPPRVEDGNQTKVVYTLINTRSILETKAS